MLITAEIRWFLRGTLPEEVSRWFETVCGTTTLYPTRVDLYLALPETDAVGVKLREGLLEVKRKDGDLGLLNLHPNVAGHGNTWTKWSFPASMEEGHLGDLAPNAPGWLAVAKTRRLSTLTISPDGVVDLANEGPALGRACWIELTEVRMDHDEWWSLGFEAVGPKECLQEDLERAAQHLFGLSDPPTLTADTSFAYPHLLRIHGGASL
jgi:hypothetical protein